MRPILELLIRHSLHASGLLALGRRNAAQIEVVRNKVTLLGLPAAFSGFTILHLSDLHVGTSEGALNALPQAMSDLAYDICVITGDFLGKRYDPQGAVFNRIASILKPIGKPIYGVLGNSDSTGMLPALGRIGIRMLVNEAEMLQRGAERLWVAGLAYSRSFKAADLVAALASVPAGETVLLLSHKADGYEQAERAGVDLLLSGHTHGGQICLPGRFPVVTRSHIPRRFVSGSWRYGRMAGYTSRGVGTRIVEARFNCPPEITLHILQGEIGGLSEAGPSSAP